MKLRMAILAGVGALALAPSAQAATAVIVPAKKCYRSGEKVGFGGAGFTPNSTVNVTSNGSSIGSLSTDERGFFGGNLTVGQRTGQRRKTYQAIDTANPAITAAKTITVSALTVGVRPRNGRPGRRMRIKARGFTNKGTLRAHVVRGRYRRNVRIGRVKGACGKVKARKRIFVAGTKSGTYTVQFDTRRRYSRKTKVRVRYRVTVFRRFVPRGASASAVSWQRIP